MKNIAVFYGGVSVEHDVSVITGVLVVNALSKEKYNAIPIYVSKSGKWYTSEKLKDIECYKNLDFKKLAQVTMIAGDNKLYLVKGKKVKELHSISVAVNCMHGERGEDGSLAGLLNMCAVPLASPDMLASAVCMDKAFTKTVMKGLGIKTLPFVVIKDISECESKCNSLGYPLIVKPCSLGSSIGVKRVNDTAELLSAVTSAFRFGEKVIIEPCLEDFIEINCAVYRDSSGEIKVSECEKPMGNSKVLSFDDKYKNGKREFPADIDKRSSEKIKQITAKAYEGVFLEGVVRIDYFLCGKAVYLNEVNTVPGSLAYYLFENTVSGFAKILSRLIDRAERKFNQNTTLQKTFNTTILNIKGAKGKNTCKS